MAGNLAGKVTVITGGTSGIGLASVDLFVAEAARREPSKALGFVRRGGRARRGR